MRDEKFLSFDLFFSLRERVKTRELSQERSRKRETKSLLDSKQKAKILFKEEQKVSLFRSKKIQKNSKRILQQRKQRKNYKKKKKSVGKELDASLRCADLYSPRSLKIKCSRLREEGLPLRNEDIEAFSEEEEILVVVLSKTLKKQTTF